MKENKQVTNKILIDLLNLANLTKAKCSNLLEKHKNSLDTYIYKFKGPVFPSSFSYFFLNSISTSLLPLFKSNKTKKKFEYFKEIDHSHQKNFFTILNKCKNLSIKDKLIMPCLEHHILALIKISNFENIHDQDALMEEYIEIILPGYLEEISFLEEYQLTEDQSFSNFHVKRINDYKILIDTIRQFFPLLEILRKHYMKNFVAPHETFNLPVLNSNNKILFSKDFIKRNLNINKYNDLILMNVEEDNMEETFNKNDIALIIKFQNKVLPHSFKDGIYALHMNNKIIIRRLQFLELTKRTLVNIISDNKKYSDQKVPLEDLNLFGEVVWKCNSFKDIQFNKYTEETLDLFLPEEEIIIPKLLEKEIA